MKTNVLTVLFMAALLAAAGCRDTDDMYIPEGEAGYGYGDTREVPGQQTPEAARAASITEDQFIEYVARVQVIQNEFQQDYAAAIEAEDMETAEAIQANFNREAEREIAEMGVTPEEIGGFEAQNPGFLQNPDIQSRVMDRVEELLQ